MSITSFWIIRKSVTVSSTQQTTGSHLRSATAGTRLHMSRNFKFVPHAIVVRENKLKGTKQLRPLKAAIAGPSRPRSANGHAAALPSTPRALVRTDLKQEGRYSSRRWPPNRPLRSAANWCAIARTGYEADRLAPPRADSARPNEPAGTTRSGERCRNLILDWLLRCSTAELLNPPISAAVAAVRL